MPNLTRKPDQKKDQSPRFIETELGREKLCIECQEYWPLDDEFWFCRKVKLLSGATSKRYEAACKCCYSVRYRPHHIKGTNQIKSAYEKWCTA